MDFTTEPARPGHLAPLIVERQFIARTLNLLRAAPRIRCFWCSRLLEAGGVCAVCDADQSGAWS